jgi:hypothetical protein
MFRHSTSFRLLAAPTIMLFVLLPAAADTVLQATAYVSFVDTPPKVVSRDGSPVQQSASGAGSSATAHASETSVGAAAHSEDGVLSEGALASASAFSTFTVTSTGSGTSLPLTFNLGVSGSISVTSDFVPSGGPNISVASVSVRSNVDRAESNGGIQMGSQDGYLVLYSTSGSFGAGGSSAGQVIADLQVHLADPLNAIPFELLPVVGEFTILGHTLGEVSAKLDLIIHAIEETARNIGFPDLGIGPGKTIPVWTVRYIINNSAPVTVPVTPNDHRIHNISLYIVAQAASAPVATADANYSNTLTIKEVTVPLSYQGNPDDIVVTFESGRILHAKWPASTAGKRRAVRH